MDSITTKRFQHSSDDNRSWGQTLLLFIMLLGVQEAINILQGDRQLYNKPGGGRRITLS